MANQVVPLPSNKPDTEVSARPRRRTYTAAYKLKVLDEVAAATERGAVAVILRREGLYASHLAAWRKELRNGGVAALQKKRGRKPAQPVDGELVRLQRENAKLSRRLAQAEAIIDVQKKVASLLGITLKTLDNDESDS
jgi:transposase-like protein